MPWQSIVAAMAQIGDTTLINADGIFVYAGVPTLGNLLTSIAVAAGTDAFGNSYPQGLNVSTGSAGSKIYVQATPPPTANLHVGDLWVVTPA